MGAARGVPHAPGHGAALRGEGGAAPGGPPAPRQSRRARRRPENPAGEGPRPRAVGPADPPASRRGGTERSWAGRGGRGGGQVPHWRLLPRGRRLRRQPAVGHVRRDTGAVRALRPPDHRGPRRSGLHRHKRAVGRVGPCPGHPVPRRPRRRPLRPKWHEDVDDPRWDRRLGDRLCPHGSAGRPGRHQLLHRRVEHARPHQEAHRGHELVLALRASLRGRPRPGDEQGRARGRRLLAGQRVPGAGSHRLRLGPYRHSPVRLGAGHRLGQAEAGLRLGAGGQAGHPVHARRQRDRASGGTAARLPGGVERGPGQGREGRGVPRQGGRY